MKVLYGTDDLSQYDGTELSLVVEFTLADGTRTCDVLATLDRSDVDLREYQDGVLFYSVYLHCIEGGVVCVADFDNLDDAQVYCHALDSILNAEETK